MLGRFITFEGGEGAGKSTQIARAADWLRSHGVQVLVTREPGGTPRAERLRTILLERDTEAMPQSCELLLMFAARATHLDNLVRPAVRRGVFAALLEAQRAVVVAHAVPDAHGDQRGHGQHRVAQPALDRKPKPQQHRVEQAIVGWMVQPHPDHRNGDGRRNRGQEVRRAEQPDAL